MIVREFSTHFPSSTATRCKPRTLALYAGLLNRLIIPRLGARDLRRISAADVLTLHSSLSGTPTQANRAVLVRGGPGSRSCDAGGQQDTGRSRRTGSREPHGPDGPVGPAGSRAGRCAGAAGPRRVRPRRSRPSGRPGASARPEGPPARRAHCCRGE
jgi:hypothetical protein